ncbi:MAG TPA: tetratricopeptide repeat protein [Blastocatellia bacterium]|nr:tetratricopeptide repeat protein [Blastocatellia bacterium]
MIQTPPTAESGYRTLLWHWVRRPGWSVIAPILLTAFAGVFAWQIFFSQSDLDKGLAALAAAHRSARPFEARIAGFSHAPYSGTVQVDSHKFKLAESLLQPQLESEKTPAVVYARGKFLLTQQKFDEAIQQFELARQNDPNNPQLCNDLGAAWLEKATAQRTAAEATQWFAQSRRHLEQALQLDRNLSEALFNLALLKSRLGLWDEAEEGWQAYLLHDARSGWAQEAKAYLNRIKTLKQPMKQSNV